MNARIAAILLGLALLFAAATDYIPGFIDSQGRVFGLFKLDIYKDALHVASALWAFAAAALSKDAARKFLQIFGVLYFLDGCMGVVTGSGYLDLSILTQGWLNNPQGEKFFSSLPHLGLGAFGAIAGFLSRRTRISVS